MHDLNYSNIIFQRSDTGQNHSVIVHREPLTLKENLISLTFSTVLVCIALSDVIFIWFLEF